MRRRQRAGRGIEQGTARRTGELAFIDAPAQIALKPTVQLPDQRRVQVFLSDRNHQEVGSNPLGGSVAKSYFHPVLDQILCRISVINSLRVSWRVRKAPSKLLVMT